MRPPHPRLFTIPPSAPFLRTLIGSLLDGRLVPDFRPRADPLALAGATIYLPTRRACRLAREVFLDALASDAAVLPRLVPLGEIDEDELVFAQAGGPLAALDLHLPPALSGLDRKLLLGRLVADWAKSQSVRHSGEAPLVAAGPSAALALAEALSRLIDDMITRAVAWDRLDGLVPDHVDPYWQLTLKFLKLAREEWPALLQRWGAMEPASRRDRLIAAESERLQRHASGPVIAAGSTASMPATAALLAAIARLPQGAVILPGLDTHLDGASWDMIGRIGTGDTELGAAPAIGHPQFAMHGFLAMLGVQRDEVTSLCDPAGHGRDRLVSEALRPAPATDLWSVRLASADCERALERLAVIEAANPEEEALAIAVALREAVERPEAQAALVTPDRGLARRVVAALARWQVTVEDSGGRPLADAPAGVVARLAADVALGGAEPTPLLALLKHPLTRIGKRAAAHIAATAALERAVLRGPRPRPGVAGLTQALASLRGQRQALHRGDPRLRLRDDEIEAASDLVGRLGAALAPLEGLDAAARPASDLAQRHLDVFLALTDARDGEDDDVPGLREIVEALEELAASPAARTWTLRPRDYPEFFLALVGDRVIRDPPNPSAQVRILGLLEARLQHVDRMVLGALNEASWPPQARPDPWLSRPMRLQLGLDLPERRVGLSAHDFAQALGTSEVVLSRATRSGGAPTVASRFLQRLAAVAGEGPWLAARTRGERYVALARRLDEPERVQRLPRPAPTPPLAARPKRLSVTEIEHWLRDPYTIYAKHILRLLPLDPVDVAPGARDRGSAVHAAVEAFTKQTAMQWPDDPLAELLAIGREQFAPLADFPEARAFWWPRFERVAQWFVGWDRKRRENVAELHVEVQGEIAIAAGEGAFTLRTRADRIERRGDGSYAILDYKTGQVATEPQVRMGFAPQLTLEAAILRAGGFPAVPAGSSVGALAYAQLKGGEPAGKECQINLKDGGIDQHADRALIRLRELIAKFSDPRAPYYSLVHPMWSTRYGDYDHLARVKEWSATGGDEAEEF